MSEINHLAIAQILKSAAQIIDQHEIEISYKDDNSIVTNIDLLISDFIMQELKKHTKLPIISEENMEELNAKLEDYWLLDPIDGTKHFANGKDDYAICLALIQNKQAKYGFIYQPTTKKIYYNDNIKDSKVITLPSIILSSQPLKQEMDLINISFRKQDYNIIKRSSCLKAINLLQGEANIYLRITPCKTWDVAAVEALLKPIDYKLKLLSGQDFCYSLDNIEMPPFIIYHSTQEKNALEIINNYK
jgi:3'(2'), 5'-bisphosphate nucleotidase